MKNDRNINWSGLDFRALTPSQRQIIQHAAIVRAHRERAAFIRAGLGLPLKWLDRAVEMALRAYFTPKISAPRSRRG